MGTWAPSSLPQITQFPCLCISFFFFFMFHALDSFFLWSSLLQKSIWSFYNVYMLVLFGYSIFDVWACTYPVSYISVSVFLWHVAYIHIYLRIAICCTNVQTPRIFIFQFYLLYHNQYLSVCNLDSQLHVQQRLCESKWRPFAPFHWRICA